MTFYPSQIFSLGLQLHLHQFVLVNLNIALKRMFCFKKGMNESVKNINSVLGDAMEERRFVVKLTFCVIF